ncbi:hypothetical protein BDV96DRAFT_649802 [Lophiotrema nucula]|uniref:Uncharacterized protein n=1 Tax=Lophiotrema nucula TaxID=690887 RepID=A0A6A5YXB8_9PLEO|nr:hypothetical protein BDV96DRAFT_649802 [Lophiotrema nucula]
MYEDNSPSVGDQDHSTSSNDQLEDVHNDADDITRAPLIVETLIDSDGSLLIQPFAQRYLAKTGKSNPCAEREDWLYNRSPATAVDLQKYRKHLIKTGVLKRNAHGTLDDLKVNPERYNSTLHQDLGLCFNTFCTPYSCRQKCCPWRHDKLNEEEVGWLLASGTEFVQKAEVFWSRPCEPVKVTGFRLEYGEKHPCHLL